jgi:hypothetical protein
MINQGAALAADNKPQKGVAQKVDASSKAQGLSLSLSTAKVLNSLEKKIKTALNVQPTTQTQEDVSDDISSLSDSDDDSKPPPRNTPIIHLIGEPIITKFNKPKINRQAVARKNSDSSSELSSIN